MRGKILWLTGTAQFFKNIQYFIYQNSNLPKLYRDADAENLKITTVAVIDIKLIKDTTPNICYVFWFLL